MHAACAECDEGRQLQLSALVFGTMPCGSSERHEHDAVDRCGISVGAFERMLHHAVVIRGVARFKNREFVAVRELDLAADADDEFLALVGGDHGLCVGRKLDAERIHVAVGLAHRKRIVGVAGFGFSGVCHLDGVEFAGAGDDRVRLELVVHERAETLPERARKLREHSKRGEHLALFYGIDHILRNAALLRQVVDAHVKTFAIHANPFTGFCFLGHLFLVLSRRLRVHCAKRMRIIPKETHPCNLRLLDLMCDRAQTGADLAGVAVCPFVRERFALVRLHGMDSAPVVRRQPDARIVRTAFEDEAAPVGGDIGLVLYELRLHHAEISGDAGNLRLGNPDDSVRDATAGSATLAFELADHFDVFCIHAPESLSSHDNYQRPGLDRERDRHVVDGHGSRKSRCGASPTHHEIAVLRNRSAENVRGQRRRDRIAVCQT